MEAKNQDVVVTHGVSIQVRIVKDGKGLALIIIVMMIQDKITMESREIVIMETAEIETLSKATVVNNQSGSLPTPHKKKPTKLSSTNKSKTKSTPPTQTFKPLLPLRNSPSKTTEKNKETKQGGFLLLIRLTSTIFG